jgi:hypothetical protein
MAVTSGFILLLKAAEAAEDAVLVALRLRETVHQETISALNKRR